MNKSDQLLSNLKSAPIIAILRGVTPEKVLEVGDLLVSAGVSVIEVPLNSPDAFSSITQIVTPATAPYTSHVFHQYTMQLKGVDRDKFIAYLGAKDIPCMIYYPVPGHLQKMFGGQNNNHLDLPVTNALTPCVCSLPIHTEMDAEQLAYIVEGVKSFFN